MKVTNAGIPVYTISGASTARPLPDWLARRRKRSLKNDPEYANRVELLQDFEFEEASKCVRVSEDGNWAMSTGTYKPQIHVHELNNLSLSFARHTISENVTFRLLSSSYEKSIHLQEDRRVELHTPNGCHYQVRIPRYGRDLVWDRHAAEAFIPSVGVNEDRNGEVFRLNLEVGRFMKSFEVDVGGDDDTSLQGSIDVGSVNCAAIAENTHGLACFGTSIGTVEFFDTRSKTRVATLGGHDGEVTALDYNPSGLGLTLGLSSGIVKIFDMRTPVPLLTKDHGFGLPIQNLIHLTTSSQEKKILSSDKRTIKIWDESTGDSWTTIEPLVDINHVAHVPGSGMLLTANEGKSMHSFLVPQLGGAPKWCLFLDNMVEEMAEDVRTETYDNYKFLTIPELKTLNLVHLIGKTNLLRPYMHGYFVDAKLYEQARVITNPYQWEEERTKRIKEKVEKERESRIRGHKKVKVNQKMANKLLRKQERREKVDSEAGLLGDSRFSKFFEDEEFMVDETSWEFRALNPSTKVEGATGQPETRPSARQDSDNESEDSEDETEPPTRVSADDVVMRVSSSQGQGRRTRDSALGSRVPHSGRVAKVRHNDVVGEQQVTFVPESRRKQQSDKPNPTRRADSRRSASTNTFRRL